MIGEAGGPRPVELDWMVTAQRSGYKIIDLSIDNVNQTLIERAQLGDLLARTGGSLPALIAQLQAESGQLNG